MPLHSSNNHFTYRKQLGSQGEQAVVEELTKNGYSILATNYQKKVGEIDIIAQKNEILAFIEVKLRTKQYFNTSQVIIPSKQQKIIKTAKYFILEHKLFDYVYRFDVALVEYKDDTFVITYIPNAFTKS